MLVEEILNSNGIQFTIIEMNDLYLGKPRSLTEPNCLDTSIWL